MATRRILIDFYRVVMPDDASRFEEVLDAVGEIDAASEERNVDIRGYPIRLHTLSATGGRRSGELVKIRMEEVPVRASLTGDLDPFELEEDEGVGEETAFTYYPSLGVLVVQRNRIGVSAYALAQYFQALSELDGFIVLEPIIEPETLARLARMRVVRRLDVRFAGVRHPNVLQEEGAPAVGVQRMLDLIETFEAPSARITLSMGHERRGTLDVQRAKRTARRLLRISEETEAVTKIEISGRSGEDEPLVLDLLEDRVVEQGDVELDADRRLPYSRRRIALRRAFQRRQDQLLALYGQPR